jgi:hypothetical protein
VRVVRTPYRRDIMHNRHRTLCTHGAALTSSPSCIMQAAAPIRCAVLCCAVYCVVPRRQVLAIMQVLPTLNLFLKAAFNGYQYGEGCEPKCIGDNYGGLNPLRIQKIAHTRPAR